MAFGKASDTKRVKNAVLEDQLVKTYVLTTERTGKLWKKKWGWIFDEYNDLHRKLTEISKDSQFLSDINKGAKEEDHRRIESFPDTTNHEYGWIPTQPDFKLEKYGPDCEKPPPLPPHYAIFKGV